jgi:hypothetical protein
MFFSLLLEGIGVDLSLPTPKPPFWEWVETPLNRQFCFLDALFFCRGDKFCTALRLRESLFIEFRVLFLGKGN